MHVDTRIARGVRRDDDPHRATSPPLYQTATFAQPGADGDGAYDYSRSGNPTREVLEHAVRDLEGGAFALSYASGMAAVAAVARLVGAGGRVLAGDDSYGGTFRLLTRVLPALGIAADFVDTTDARAVRDAIRPDTKLVLVETPTNPMQRVVDLAALAGLCRSAGACFAVDNTFASPVLQRPLEHGADLVVHSATKFLAGHGDATAGVVVGRDAALGEELAFARNAEGSALAPFEAWLVARGMQTMALRVERAQRSAVRIARWLDARPDVARVHYVGSPSHPGHALHARQADGPGAVIGFETGSADASRRVVEATRLFSIAVSFGGVRSQISLPGRMSHASIPAAVRAARALPDDLVRVAVGIEDADDLIADLDAAFAAARRGESGPALRSGSARAVQPRA